MKALFFMGLLILSTNVFAEEPKVEAASGEPEIELAPLVPPDPTPAKVEVPDIMAEDVPENVKKDREKELAKLKKKYAKSPPRLAQKEIELGMIKFNADNYIRLRKELCMMDKKKCPQMKAEIAAIEEQKAQKSKAPEESYKLDMKASEEKLDTLASDCFKQQKPEFCQALSEANKEHEKKFGEIYFTADEVAAYEKPKFKAASCKWSFDLPRRVISRPGCGQGKSMSTCVGYVICDPPEGTIKVVRMSTCSPENCGDNDAAKCTQEQGFSSKNKAEFFDTASEKVKSAIGAGAVAQ